MKSQKTFSYAGFSIRVEADDERHIGWLCEFLHPGFIEENGQADIEIQLHSDPEQYDTLMGYGSGDDSIDAYILDTSIIDFPVWNTPGPELAFYEEKNEVFYLVGGNRIVLVDKNYSERSRVPVMRVIREFAMGFAQQSGGRFLHASAFDIQGKAAVITGPRYAGKTSLLTYVLKNSTASFLANDRLLVNEGSTGIRLRGMPTIISVRSGTLEFFPDILSSLRDRGFEARLMVEECKDSSKTRRSEIQRDKYGLTTRQYCSLLDCDPVGESRAVTLLFPSQTGRAGGISLKELDHEETRQRLEHCLFNNIGPDRLSDVFTPVGTGRHPILDDDRLCEWLSTEVTAFECRLGNEAYLTPDGAKQLSGIVSNAA